MILPTSIPSWQKIIENLNKKDADLKLNVDPFTGKHGGTLFYKEKAYAFKIEVFPKNMVLSLKNADIEILDLFAYAFEFNYSIIYKTLKNDDIFNIHAEWYYKCTDEDITSEIALLEKSPEIHIIKK
jgi:hypothetical protein